MLTLLLLAVVSLEAVLASPSYYNSVPANVINQHNLDGSGGFAFQTVDGQTRTESRNHDGSVKGSYTYTAPDGQQVVVNYIADEKGYRADGNNLPQASQPVAPSSYRQQQQYEYQQPQYQPNNYYHDQYRQPAQPAPFTSFVVNHPAARTVVTPYGYTLTSL